MERAFTDKLADFLQEALAEDLGAGDFTTLSTIPQEAQGQAKLLVKEVGVLAGVDVAEAIFQQIDPALHIQILLKDGQKVSPGDIVLEIKGKVHSILKAERLVLNIMQRMSGIATATARYVEKTAGTKAKILDTRKTTPLLRFLEKRAVEIAGGVNHRFGLYDMILIKDNHVDYAGGIQQAVQSAFNYRNEHQLNIPIEVEVRSLEELQEVLALEPVDRVMFDNFSPELTRKAVELVDGRLITESSGGITLDDVADYAKTGVDFISIGALTHSVKSLDLSLKAQLIS